MSSHVDAFKQSGSSPTEPDFFVENHGSIFLLRPLTDPAQTWIEEHLPEDAQRLGNAVAVEPRYIVEVVAGIRSDGLVIV